MNETTLAFFFMPFDIFILPGLILGIYAQMKLMNVYRRYIREPASRGLSGAEAARSILDAAGLADVSVRPIPGALTDHYDPTRRTLFLSQDNFYGRSLAALGVAAHEAGHALQHQAAYAPLQLRMALVPATALATKAAFLILFGGMALMMIGFLHPVVFAKLLPWAIGAYGVVALFQLITLPVEYDASRRAKRRLLALGLIDPAEAGAVSRVLNAAALTYVAALVTAVLELLRLVMLAQFLGGNDA
ncbi:MAG: zinc metallopeptidase [Verrucomicrobia bacterium]|nr:zinc metallopeptidase [Verrucomicrobiota bacterium]